MKNLPLKNFAAETFFPSKLWAVKKPVSIANKTVPKLLKCRSEVSNWVGVIKVEALAA